MDIDLAVVVVKEPQAHLLGVLGSDQSLGEEAGEVEAQPADQCLGCRLGRSPAEFKHQRGFRQRHDAMVRARRVVVAAPAPAGCGGVGGPEECDGAGAFRRWGDCLYL